MWRREEALGPRAHLFGSSAAADFTGRYTRQWAFNVPNGTRSINGNRLGSLVRDARIRKRRVSLFLTVGLGLWLLASIGFKMYVLNFSNYAAVYGAIGSVIVLLLWFYMSGFALLVGAELNAEIDKALDAQRARQDATDRKKIGPAADRAYLQRQVSPSPRR